MAFTMRFSLRMAVLRGAGLVSLGLSLRKTLPREQPPPGAQAETAIRVMIRRAGLYSVQTRKRRWRLTLRNSFGPDGISSIFIVGAATNPVLGRGAVRTRAQRGRVVRRDTLAFPAKTHLTFRDGQAYLGRMKAPLPRAVYLRGFHTSPCGPNMRQASLAGLAGSWRSATACSARTSQVWTSHEARTG